MSLGLAAHRLHDDGLARAAFDTASRLLGPAELKRLDNWLRVLRPTDAKARADATDAERMSQQRLYWRLADPVWAEATDRLRIEFLSRVAFAELRWTVEESDLRGADTDRGDKYVRYGPPDQTIVISPSANQWGDITTFWIYNSGFLFAFRGMPTFLTSHSPGEDLTLVQGLEQSVPVRWDNIPSPVTDSLDARVARFRAAPGLLDVVIAARLNAPDSIKQSMSVGDKVQRYFWIVAPGAGKTYRNTGPVDSAGVYTWSQRVESVNLVYRVEEFGATASRAGRTPGAGGQRGIFPPLGFGVSDVLLARSAASAGPTARTVERLSCCADGRSDRERGQPVSRVGELRTDRTGRAGTLRRVHHGRAREGVLGPGRRTNS